MREQDTKGKTVIKIQWNKWALYVLKSKSEIYCSCRNFNLFELIPVKSRPPIKVHLRLLK